MKVLVSILLFGLMYVPSLSAAQQEPRHVAEKFQLVDKKQSKKLKKAERRIRKLKDKRSNDYNPKSEFRKASMFSWFSIFAFAVGLSVWSSSSAGFALLALVTLALYLASVLITMRVLRYAKKHDTKLLKKARRRFVWTLVGPMLFFALATTTKIVLTWMEYLRD